MSKEPEKVRTITGDEAWMYENEKSLDIYVRKSGNDTLSVRLTRQQVEDWMCRMDAKARRRAERKSL